MEIFGREVNGVIKKQNFQRCTITSIVKGVSVTNKIQCNAAYVQQLSFKYLPLHPSMIQQLEEVKLSSNVKCHNFSKLALQSDQHI